MSLFAYFIGSILLMGIGLWTSRIAEKKGHNPTLWFVLGILFALPAVLVAYLLPAHPSLEKKKTQDSMNPTNRPTPPLSPQIIRPSQWYYLNDEEKRFGPFSYDQFMNEWDLQSFSEDNYIWNEDLEDWILAKDSEDLPKKAPSS